MSKVDLVCASLILCVCVIGDVRISVSREFDLYFQKGFDYHKLAYTVARKYIPTYMQANLHCIMLMQAEFLMVGNPYVGVLHDDPKYSLGRGSLGKA